MGAPLPRPVSLQNAYSLLCRTFDAGLAECCHSERISLLAYSPLAMGLLSGECLKRGLARVLPRGLPAAGAGERHMLPPLHTRPHPGGAHPANSTAQAST